MKKIAVTLIASGFAAAAFATTPVAEVAPAAATASAPAKKVAAQSATSKKKTAVSKKADKVDGAVTPAPAEAAASH